MPPGEGYKTLAYEIAEAMDWEVPDWCVLPVCHGGRGSLWGSLFAASMMWSVMMLRVRKRWWRLRALE